MQKRRKKSINLKLEKDRQKERPRRQKGVRKGRRKWRKNGKRVKKKGSKKEAKKKERKKVQVHSGGVRGVRKMVPKRESLNAKHYTKQP